MSTKGKSEKITLDGGIGATYTLISGANSVIIKTAKDGTLVPDITSALACAIEAHPLLVIRLAQRYYHNQIKLDEVRALSAEIRDKAFDKLESELAEAEQEQKSEPEPTAGADEKKTPSPASKSKSKKKQASEPAKEPEAQ